MEEQNSVPVVKACNCLPDCNSIEYEIKVVETKFQHKDHYVTFGNVSYYVGSTYYGGLAFSFGDTEYHAIARYSNHASTEFLSDIGGLLGLFLGVSVLSFVEIIYFFVLRFASVIVRYFKKQRSSQIHHRSDLSLTIQEIM